MPRRKAWDIVSENVVRCMIWKDQATKTEEQSRRLGKLVGKS